MKRRERKGKEENGSKSKMRGSQLQIITMITINVIRQIRWQKPIGVG